MGVTGFPGWIHGGGLPLPGEVDEVEHDHAGLIDLLVGFPLGGEVVDVFFDGNRQRVRAIAPGKDVVDDRVDRDQCGVFLPDVSFDEAGEAAVGAAVKVVGAKEIVGHAGGCFLPLFDKDKGRVFIEIAGDEPSAGTAVDLHLFLGDVGLCR